MFDLSKYIFVESLIGAMFKKFEKCLTLQVHGRGDDIRMRKKNY